MNPFFVALAALIVLRPLFSRRRWRHFLARAGQPGARVRLYQRMLVYAWATTGLLALGLRWERASFRDIGLVAPRLAVPAGVAVEYVVLAVAALLVPVLLPGLRRRVLRLFGDTVQLFPATAGERLWFVAVALTAGFTEELLFRGFVLGWGNQLTRGGLSLEACLVLGAVPFGWAHLYQGWRGVLLTGLAGMVLMSLYLQFGSLWVPIGLHALIDLRALLFGPPPLRAPLADA